ncbi:hypothetical protein ANO14919_004780 [Xylariales sp. No.14919]|nr:hypothetical protein ANO14919_004780 [Xylariales sp. No.14919]
MDSRQVKRASRGTTNSTLSATSSHDNVPPSTMQYSSALSYIAIAGLLYGG